MADKTGRTYYEQRISGMKKERSSFLSHYKELSENISPRRGRFFISDRNRGNRRHTNIINSRGTQALRTAQSGIFAGVMSPARPWFKLEVLDPDLMKEPSVKDWLFKVERLMRTIFLESNLYSMAPVALGELILFGTSAMSQVDDFENVVRFYTHTAGSYMIAQNNRFEVDTFAQEKELPVKQIVQEFGLANVSVSVKDRYDRGNYEVWMPVVQVIEPNPDFDDTKEDSKFKAFRSVWYEPGNTGRPNQFLRNKGFDEFPVHVTRWAVAGEDIYGTDCPGMISLGDIKGLQIMEKRKSQAVDKLVNPPLKGPPSLRDVPITTLPGGVNIYETDNSGEGLKAVYQVDPRLQEMRADIQGIEQRINEAFFVDLFLAISAMEGVQPRNQLELSQRNEERLLMLGPPLERIQLEFESKIIDRTFNQMVRAEILPPPPPELQGQAIAIRYISALAQAQRSVEVTTIERAALFVGQLAQISPQVVDKFNADEAFEQYTRMTGTIPSIVVSDEQVADIRQARAEAEQARLQAELQASQAGAAQSAAKAVKDVSDAGGGGGEAV